MGASEDPYAKLKPGPGISASDVSKHQRVRIVRATVDLVAEQGYYTVKVRQLVRLAGVSSRAFYQNFESKEDCLLRTHEMVARRACGRIIAAQAEEPDWRKRLRLVFDAFARELEREPRAARFALIEVYVATPSALEQARQVERTFEGMVSESLARYPNGIAVPPLIVEGIVAGIAQVARTRVRVGRRPEIMGLGDELMKWAFSYPGEFADQLIDLDSQSIWRNTLLEPPISPIDPEGGETWPPTGDRALLLSSVADLAASDGYDKLTVSRICAEASVPRKVFHANFTSVEDCLVAALKQKGDGALAQAARAQTAGRNWPGGLYRALVALCDLVASDPFLARACLADHFAPGSSGSRFRQRLITALVEQLSESCPSRLRPSALALEATAGAIWSLFHHHVVRNWRQQRQISATLAFLALAPAIGPEAAVSAIRGEQSR